MTRHSTSPGLLQQPKPKFEAPLDAAPHEGKGNKKTKLPCSRDDSLVPSPVALTVAPVAAAPAPAPRGKSTQGIGLFGPVGTSPSQFNPQRIR